MKGSDNHVLIEELRDRDLQLQFLRLAEHPVHRVPTYFFRMVHADTNDELGDINLRASSTPHIERYAGHIGFSVHEPYRGHHYAARSVVLLGPLSKGLGFKSLWITCDPENVASRRTLEWRAPSSPKPSMFPRTASSLRVGICEKTATGWICNPR